jgi:hypothetical protein
MVESNESNVPKILCVRFDQGFEQIIVGTDRGFFRFDAMTGERKANRDFFPEDCEPQENNLNQGIYLV